MRIFLFNNNKKHYLNVVILSQIMQCCNEIQVKFAVMAKFKDIFMQSAMCGIAKLLFPW